MRRKTKLLAVLCPVLVLAAAALAWWLTRSQPQPTSAADHRPGVVMVNQPGAFQGYTLIFPLLSTETHLDDMQGRVVHSWHSEYPPGEDAHLLANGHLLRPAKLSGKEAILSGAGAGGLIQEFTWDGEIVWEFKLHSETRTQHHSVAPMPNGNVLLIVWESKTTEEALRAGVKPKLADGGDRLVDSIVEIKPVGKTGGEVVWEWHMWDHLVQDYDQTKENYGIVAQHPELIDINFGRDSNTAFDRVGRYLLPPDTKGQPRREPSREDTLKKLRAIGYVGSGSGGPPKTLIPDWTHVNSVAYNAKLDQIMLCPREFNEIWVIDHSTTTAEAAGHTGGRGGKGGNLLYRWGNPQTCRAGTAADQKLFAPHDAHWIPDGLPGAGHVLVFNNGLGRPGGDCSSVDEIVLPVDAQGSYARPPDGPYGPAEPAWSFTAARPTDFFAALLSSAQRLPNGNTLICSGVAGQLIEVTADQKVVWVYVNQPPRGISPAIFRAFRYGPDHPALVGRLTSL
jgi:hypothetical protein